MVTPAGRPEDRALHETEGIGLHIEMQPVILPVPDNGDLCRCPGLHLRRTGSGDRRRCSGKLGILLHKLLAATCIVDGIVP
ncbi:MAG: hypothetical protein MZV70_57595 [Desulfobacterales bacterium]|nr:hypothetical protein [Desulfobacterales bacterium]